ncbi:hypothetical protein BJY01DRAFT_247279 [Aspergillus pseudoustus]|uniref:UbiA prenyltransferase family-domain-containing protein n=1 Tax=Aspergillus pseudoustus TaxID=1810923 RepID=A0ABR4K221_9EURO
MAPLSVFPSALTSAVVATSEKFPFTATVGTVPSRTPLNRLTHFFRMQDARTRKLLAIEVAALAVFPIYTTILFKLPLLWSDQSLSSEQNQTSSSSNSILDTILSPANRSLKNEDASLTHHIAVDVWFALVLLPTFDAITILTTFNSAIIARWHSFISIRMILLAYLASYTVILSGKPRTSAYINKYPVLVFMLGLVIYGALGACLDLCRAPLPRKKHGIMNLRKWTISEYVNFQGRSNGTWRAAVVSTVLTCGLAPLLAIIVPVEWSSIIPVIAVAFETIILRTPQSRRTWQYTLISAPIFHGGICIHWGLRQMVSSPELVLQPWMFLLLLVASRMVEDVHLRTIFGDCAEFQWARRNALLPTRRLVQIAVVVLVLEYMRVPVLRWVKPVAVLVVYLASIVAITLPAAYNVVFGRESERTEVVSR